MPSLSLPDTPEFEAFLVRHIELIDALSASTRPVTGGYR